MIKGWILLFNLLGIFLSGIFFPGTVTVTQTSPATAEINNSILVQISINKGELTGPAKFVEHLPVGFNAVAVDDESAYTSFDSNTILFSWSSIPPDGILNISFRVDINSLAAVQNDVLSGKFLYTLNNENSEADCSSTISITGAQGSAIASGSPAQNTIPQNNSSVQNSNNQPGSNPGEAYVEREFSSLAIAPNSTVTVTLSIHKPAGGGFARIEDSIPPGFTANRVNSSGASFTFIDNMAKFVWQNIAANSVITVSYLMTAGPDVSGSHTINGDFSYIYNGAPVSIYIGNTTFNVSAASNNPVAQNIPVAAPRPHTDSTPKSPTHAENKRPLVLHENTPLTTKPITSVIDSTPVSEKTQTREAKKDMVMPAKGVTYKVQIIALKNPGNMSSLLKRKNIKDPVHTETGEGFTKYTVGNYSSYSSAQAKMNEMINKGFYGAFVVCYKAGVRITLHEALSGN